ncbi:MAG: Na(+)/H(+) antiporter subunit C [Verrucomicrobiaceae bacterium]|nr:MAG: Na(+)/H(+) antiporter subunit C [Verrucomicrobiaceae bacterium]
MQFETALLIGVMFSIATYLLLRKNFIHILFGFLILSNGSNLFILAMSGDPEGKVSPVLIKGGGPIVDPMPQALVLTAIVIGFGLTVYLIMLLYRIFLDTKTTDAESLFLPEADDE